VGSVHLFRPGPSLGPDELHIASDAFDAALRAVVGPLAAMPPERVRDILAKYIAERALMGERDPETLRDGALECLSLMARSGVFSGASARVGLSSCQEPPSGVRTAAPRTVRAVLTGVLGGGGGALLGRARSAEGRGRTGL